VFGTAANNGQMVAEVSAHHRAAEAFRDMAQLLSGRSEMKKSKGGLFTPLLGKLMKRK
jgi:pilus assembly protein CpaE